MTILRFDRDSLAQELSPLPTRLRAAFAAACAQRLMPCYLRSASENPSANPQAVVRILSDLWSNLEKDSYRPGELRENVAICKSLIPDDERKYFAGIEYAEDAIVALAYAIQTKLTSRAQEAVWAAGRAADAVNTYVVQLLGVEIFRSGDHARLETHPLIQAEYRRQRADLVDLRSAARNPGSERAIIARIRRRAESDAAFLFGREGGP